jgi:hypothetical protein
MKDSKYNVESGLAYRTAVSAAAFDGKRPRRRVNLPKLTLKVYEWERSEAEQSTIKDFANVIGFFGVGSISWPTFLTLSEGLIRDRSVGVLFHTDPRCQSWRTIKMLLASYPSIQEYPTPSENCSFCLHRMELGRYG